MHTPPTLEEIVKAYQRAIIARRQMRWFQGWGESIQGLLRGAVVEHEELERRFLEQPPNEEPR